MTLSQFVRVRSLTLAVAGLLVAAAGARAGDSPWYVQASLGEASLEARFGSLHSKVFDSEESAQSVEVGYRFNRYLALQVGVHDLGEHAGMGSPCSEDAPNCIERLALDLGLCAFGRDCLEVFVPVVADVKGVSLSVVPRWPVTDRLGLAGKLGWIDWESEITGLFVGEAKETFSDEDLLTGVGLHYDFPSGLGLRLEYESFDLDLGVASAGLSWRF